MTRSEGSARNPRTPAGLVEWRLEQLADIDRQWLLRRRLLVLACQAGLLSLVVLLSIVGYPVWRVVGLAILFLIIAGSVLVDLFRARSGTKRSFVSGESGNHLISVVVLLAAGLTGGLHSPLIVLPIVIYGLSLSGFGQLAAGLRPALVTALGVLIIGLFPSGWEGPPVREPAFTIMALYTYVMGLTMVADRVLLQGRMLDRALAQLYQARDEVANQALARARELEQVGGRLSHELKNPLAAIKTLVQLSERRATDPVARKQLQVVTSEVERMSAIIREHLSFSRPLEELSVEPVELSELVDATVAVLVARAGAAGVGLRRIGAGQVRCDPRRLKGALINLIANAIEASPREGTVEIVIEAGGPEIRLSVRDHGAGMAPEVLDRIGTPFFTTREHGTGLGVSLARSVFTQHGGRLEYRSRPGEGTTAIGVLPCPPEGLATTGEGGEPATS